MGFNFISIPVPTILLAVVALIGYLVGRTTKRSVGEQPARSRRELRRAQRVAVELEKIAWDLRIAQAVGRIRAVPADEQVRHQGGGGLVEDDQGLAAGRSAEGHRRTWATPPKNLSDRSWAEGEDTPLGLRVTPLPSRPERASAAARRRRRARLRAPGSGWIQSHSAS